MRSKLLHPTVHQRCGTHPFGAVQPTHLQFSGGREHMVETGHTTKRQGLDVIVDQKRLLRIAGRKLCNAHGLNSELGIIKIQQACGRYPVLGTVDRWGQ